MSSPEFFRDLKPISQFRLDGRLSVKTEAQSISGGLSWQRSAGEETMLLSTPLGQGAAEIRRQGDTVVMVGADGVVIQAASDELLMEKAVGIRLPLEGLVYWLSGLPRPEGRYRAELDAGGRLLSLEQDGWRIEYDRFRQLNGRVVPGRLFARRGDNLEFRLVVDAWETR